MPLSFYWCVGVPLDPTGGSGSIGSPQSADEGSPNSTPGKKARKPYTITKQRENWTEEEHQKFITGLKTFDRDWKKLEKYIGTKSVIQVRCWLNVASSGSLLCCLV